MPNPILSASDEVLATELALSALRDLDAPSFTVSATLNVDAPETLEQFQLFKRLLLDAYRQGAQEALARVRA